MDNRGVDTDPGWVNRKLRDLERAIQDVRSERRSAATTVGSGNWVIDGGDVVMLDTDGSVMFRLGEQDLGDRGVSIFREDGSLALTLRKTFPGAPQNFSISDNEGYLLLTEDSLGSGLSRPFLTIPMVPVQAVAGALLTGPYGVQVPIATSTFTTTHQAWYARVNQFGLFKVQISASDATTAAEVRLLDVGTNAHLAQFLGAPYTATRAAGSTGFVEVSLPGIGLPGVPEQHISIAVQVRRSAGAGTLQVALTHSSGSIA